MLIQSLLVPKENLKTVTTVDTLETALNIMENIDQRCLPVLDETNTLFRGNIYKYHIYRHLAYGGNLQAPILNLLKNSTKFILNTDSFFKLFFTLADLPYISVLNDKHHFIGIIPHKQVLQTLYQSWNVEQISYVLTIEIEEFNKDLPRLIKRINRYATIIHTLQFTRDQYTLRNRVLVLLAKPLAHSVFLDLVNYLKHKDYKILEIENLTTGI